MSTTPAPEPGQLVEVEPGADGSSPTGDLNADGEPGACDKVLGGELNSCWEKRHGLVAVPGREGRGRWCDVLASWNLPAGGRDPCWVCQGPRQGPCR